MFSLQGHRRPHTLFASLDVTGLVLATSGFQKLIQFLQVVGPRHGRPMVGSRGASRSAPTTGTARVAKLRRKAPVRAEGNKPCRLFPLVSLQNLLHGALQVVVPYLPKHAAEIVKRQLVRLQKSRLRGARISPMKSRPAGHAAQRKHLQLLPLAAQVRVSFIPVGLSFPAPGVALRHKSLPPR